MINFPSISPKIRRSLLVIDLASLAVSIWFNIMEPELQKLPSTIGYILLFTTAITPFIAILPVDRVTITGSIISNGTILEICDNGIGFSLDRPHTGFGLRNMKERVQCLGGNFNLDSEIDRGTQIKIFVPI